MKLREESILEMPVTAIAVEISYVFKALKDRIFKIIISPLICVGVKRGFLV
jgi:hypothetical protein